METAEMTQLLLAAHVREIAVKWRNHRHIGIKDEAEFSKAVSEDPLGPYVDKAIAELRAVAQRF